MIFKNEIFCNCFLKTNNFLKLAFFQQLNLFQQFEKVPRVIYKM